MRLPASWTKLEEGLRGIAEGGDVHDQAAVDVLVALDLAETDGDEIVLTSLGERYYIVRFVTDDAEGVRDALSEALRTQPTATAFCATLRTPGTVTVSGAVNLLKRLRAGDETTARRWLDLLNRAGWIAYNRAKPNLRVLYNPDELVPPDEDAEREKGRGHVIAPDTTFGNLLALRELIRSARGFIRWYEQHMPPKVLEVLYREVDHDSVSEIRILSGPVNINGDTKDDFKRFAKEMKVKRGIDVEWRVLSKREAFLHHDRFFLTEGFARNLPPLNTILKGSTGEILASDLAPDQFDEWWALGQPIAAFTPPPDS